MFLFSHRVNSFISIGLFAAMTVWLGVFYFVETRKISSGEFSPDYRTYFELVN